VRGSWWAVVAAKLANICLPNGGGPQLIPASGNGAAVRPRRAAELLAWPCQLPPLDHPLYPRRYPLEAITVRGSRSGCCHGPVFLRFTQQMVVREFRERCAVIGHRDPAFTKGGRERASLSATCTLA